MTEQPEQQDGQSVVVGTTDDGKTYVVTPQGMAVESPQPEQAAEAGQSVTDLVSQPDKVMRIATMISKLLDEVKSAPLDEPSRRRLSEIYRSSVGELRDALAPELGDELERITQPFSAEQSPTDAELRISHAQLVGWLEGLFHGIQTALVAQQMAARNQLEQMRRALPGGQPMPPQGGEPQQRGGMYL